MIQYTPVPANEHELHPGDISYLRNWKVDDMTLCDRLCGHKPHTDFICVTPSFTTHWYSVALMTALSAITMMVISIRNIILGMDNIHRGVMPCGDGLAITYDEYNQVKLASNVLLGSLILLSGLTMLVTTRFVMKTDKALNALKYMIIHREAVSIPNIRLVDFSAGEKMDLD